MNRRITIFRFVLVAAIACAYGERAAAQREWNVSNGDWFSAVNWTPIGVPNASLAAVINNGGQATATIGGPVTALSIDAGQNGGNGDLSTDSVNIAVQESLDVGDIEALVATGGVNLTSSGTATFTGATTIEFGLSGVGDMNAGQTSAADGATAIGTGTITINNVGTVTLPGDFDLGQTSGTATADGNGTAALTNIFNQLSIGGDLDVGQTSGGAGALNEGFGNFSANLVNNLSIGADFDIGQTTGEGQSTGTGLVSINDSSIVSVGDSLDVAKVRAFNAGINTAGGSAEIRDTDVLIGFGAANPGSIEIARVLTTENAVGTANGYLFFDMADVLVANDVIVGELALGGTNSSSSAAGELELLDSRIDTRDLTVASRLDGTAGTVSGSVSLHRSLAIVQGTLMLNQPSTLELAIDGTTRALGDGLPTDYSAIDADIAELGGTLSIIQNPEYLGPAAVGLTDEFQLIASLFGITGTFDNVEVDGITLGSGPTYIGESASGLDGLFASVDQTTMEVSLDLYQALPGDANGDRIVDGLDFIIWNENKFLSNTTWTTGDFNGDGITDGLDFILWNDNKFTAAPDFSTVPEPSGSVLVAIIILSMAPLRRRKCRQRSVC